MGTDEHMPRVSGVKCARRPYGHWTPENRGMRIPTSIALSPIPDGKVIGFR